jgi:predicted phosphoribosyltransferase
MFANRSEAGRKLAEKIRSLGINGFTTVFGLTRGGVPVAAEIARTLEAPLDVLVVRKIGYPGNPEYAAGAVAEEGVKVIHPDHSLSTAELDESIRIELATVRRQVRRFRAGRSLPSLNGRTAVIADDGLATGATMQAAVLAIRRKHPARIVVAVPVAPPEAIPPLAALVDHVVCLHSPEIFAAVGDFYVDFSQTSDEDVESLLKP